MGTSGRRWTRAAWAALASLVFFTAQAIGQDAPPTVRLNLLQDEGKFTYYNNEEPIGKCETRWHEDGRFEMSGSVTLAGQTIPLSLKIEVDTEGFWTSVTMASARGPIEIERSGSSVKLRVMGETHPLELEPGTLVMEDMSPSLMSQAVVVYDHEKGGKQTFPLFFIPHKVMEGSLEHTGTVVRPVGGKEQTFRKYRYEMPGIYNVDILVDDRNRVCLATYPDIHGLFVREGYGTLQVEASAEAALSEPEFEAVVERDVGVPMRDGLKLATDIYRPKRDAACPVILVRTPYKKEMGELQALFYARRGYVFAIQDVRGRFSSPGEWDPFTHEARDGYDAVEWLAAQEWSTGKVGMIGGSYLGWSQWWAASEHPPHLVTIIPNVAPPDPYFNFPYEFGIYFLSAALFWADVIEKDATADLSGVSMEGAMKIFGSEKLHHLPVIELDEIVLGKKIPSWREHIAHPDYDAYWQKRSFMARMQGFDIPVYHQSGWFDGDGIGAKRNYQGMIAHGHKNQKLVLGPWGHTDRDTRFGPKGIDFGPRAVIDLQKSYLRWMDRWLKGIENGIDEEPTVSLFVMGPNDWLHGDTYPLEGTRLTKFYLASQGDAGSLEGKGSLTTDPPGESSSTPDRYTYDPGDPTPADPRGRKDILVYTTPPMKEPMTIAGPISAVIYASSSAKDTDWFVRLAKMDEDDNPITIARGMIRARYRDSFSEPKLLEAGEVCEYRIDVWQTGIRIEKGESLKIIVSSALFPYFSRNLNTGGHNETETEYVSAEQTIYHDKDHPSHILFPVIPNPGFGKEE